MRFSLSFAALCLALTLSVPTVHAAAKIDCMDAGYTGEDKAAVDRFLKTFTLANLGQSMNDEALARAVGNRAVACSGQHGWAGDALKHSIYYRMSDLLMQALERKAPFSAADLRRMKSAFANADQARLRSVLGPKLEAEMAGQPAPEPSEEDNVFLGTVILGSGIPTSEASLNFAGSWIGAKTMRDIAAERFAAE